MAQVANAARRGVTLEDPDKSHPNPFRERFCNFNDPRLLGGAWMREPHAKEIADFFRLLAVCHTVIPDGPDDTALIKYEAESPDEAAFVVRLGRFFVVLLSASIGRLFWLGSYRAV